LLLTQRLPYPPNKGDKVRSYHLLRELAKCYRVHLGTFIDDPADLEHRDALAECCASTCIVEALGPWRKVRRATALLDGAPLSVRNFRSRQLARWVRRLAAEHPLRAAVAVSSPMAAYLEVLPGDGLVRIVDFVDLDSEKWRQYGAEARGPLGWVYRREGRLLSKLERRLAGSMDWSLFVSENERAEFLRSAPDLSGRVLAVENGVDADYFRPRDAYPDPYPRGARPIVFTGAMDYAPNIEAVGWFAAEVFPRVRREIPDASFWIVGLNPAPAVLALARQEGVGVTGRVPDVRPYLQHAALAIAPIRVARGVQNKVLEALAMGKPVVASPAAATGIHPGARTGLFEAGDPEVFAARVVAVLNATRPPAAAIRQGVTRHYDWERNLSGTAALLSGTPPGTPPGRPTGEPAPDLALEAGTRRAGAGLG